MTPKTIGACTSCDKPVFEIVRRDAERNPIQVGVPHEDAVRVTFLLVDATRMDLTFCRECAEKLGPAGYPAIWNRVMHSWVAESGADHPGGAKAHVDNAIVGVYRKQLWTEVVA